MRLYVRNLRDACDETRKTLAEMSAATEETLSVSGMLLSKTFGVLCLVEREEAKGRATVEKAAAPAQFHCIFTADDVRKEHLKQKKQ